MSRHSSTHDVTPRKRKIGRSIQVEMLCHPVSVYFRQKCRESFYIERVTDIILRVMQYLVEFIATFLTRVEIMRM